MKFNTVNPRISPRGAYLHQENFTWGLNRGGGGLFEGGGLLVRLRIDMGGLFGYQRINMGAKIHVKARGGEQCFR